MKDFTLVRPQRIVDAVAALRDGDRDRSTVLLAGGQDLLTEMKEHRVEPDRVVDVGGVPEMRRVAWMRDGGARIVANTTLAELAAAPRVREELTVLAEAVDSVASPQIRNVATVGGNLNQRPRCWYFRNEEAFCLKKGGSVCFAANGMNKYNAILGGGPSYIVHPSDLAPALIALDAGVTLEGPDGARTIPLAEYYRLPSEGDLTSETVRLPGEVVIAVYVPQQPQGLTSTYLKFKERESYDWALASVALAVTKGAAGVEHARMVLGGVAPKPWVVDVERVLRGKALGDATASAAADLALEGAKPLEHNGYKVPLTRGLVTRAFRKLA
ncbi:MAG: xanthine dehydrogenase family protein subunit M [Planctomycetota bacterium]